MSLRWSGWSLGLAGLCAIHGSPCLVGFPDHGERQKVLLLTVKMDGALTFRVRGMRLRG